MRTLIAVSLIVGGCGGTTPMEMRPAVVAPEPRTELPEELPDMLAPADMTEARAQPQPDLLPPPAPPLDMTEAPTPDMLPAACLPAGEACGVAHDCCAAAPTNQSQPRPSNCTANRCCQSEAVFAGCPSHGGSAGYYVCTNCGLGWKCGSCI